MMIPVEQGFFYELVLYPSENLRCILPKIYHPTVALRRFFDVVKRTCMCKSFRVCLIKLDLKLQQRGRPLKELRGRHVESIQFFAL